VKVMKNGECTLTRARVCLNFDFVCVCVISVDIESSVYHV
jgi:hypothetical protein